MSYGNQVDVALADGKLNLGDAPGFFDEMIATGDVYENRSKIIAEGGDVTEEEKKELHDMAVRQFDIRNDEVEAKVEAALNLLFAVLVFFAVFKKKATGDAAKQTPNPNPAKPSGK